MKNLKQCRTEYQRKQREWKKTQKVSRNKFNAQILADGRGSRKGSQLELSVLALYQLRQRDGEISELHHQAQTYLTEAEIGWRVDFSFLRDGVRWYGEAKGLELPDYMIKLRLWRVYGPGPLEIWKGNAARPRLVETVFPKKWLQEPTTSATR